MIAIETGDKVNVFVMKVKDYYRLIRKKSKEPNIIYFWNFVLDLDSDFVRKDVILFELKQIRNNKVKQFNFKMIHIGLLPQKKTCINGKLLIIIYATLVDKLTQLFISCYIARM